MKNASNLCSVTFIGMLSFVIPSICYAVISASAGITLNCASAPENAKWVPVFFGEPKSMAVLRAEGLYFKKDAWTRFFSTNLYKCDVELGENVYSDPLGVKTAETFFLNGRDLEAPEEVAGIKAYFPGIDASVTVLAACTIPAAVPIIVSQEIPASTLFSDTEVDKGAEEFAKIAAQWSIKGFADEVLNVDSTVNLWPKGKEIRCEKGQGIAVKFEQPNGANPLDTVYFATLTVFRDEDKKAQETKIEVKDLAPPSIGKDVFLSSFLPKRGLFADYLDTLSKTL